MVCNFQVALAGVGILVLLAACGGGGPPAPNAVATSDMQQGTAPLTANFDASGSTDPQSLPLTYTWNFGDGSASVTGTKVVHTFNAHGNYTVTVVADDGKAQGNATVSMRIAPAPPRIQQLSLPVNLLGVAPTSAASQISAADRENLTLSYALATPPALGTATVNATTGAITYTVPGFTNASSDSFTVTVSNPGASATATVNVTLNSDPLVTSQWHIQNTGQNAFASTLPVPGYDMNVSGAWSAGYSGKGIKVGVADSGIEAAHEDLAANMDLAHSYNFLTAAHDPSPSGTGFDHGTSVAGIIGAVAFNGKGGRGVAYNATLRGYNLIAAGAFSLANMATSLGSAAISSDNDLFNASFGQVANAIPSFSGAFQSITNATLALRGGLGAAIVNAAGNDFADFEGASSPLCALARQYGVSCGDPATDERRGGYAPIIVGALNAAGTHASYSSAGSALWISAPGGEYGINSSVTPLTGFGDPVNAVKPAVVTTARTGCANALYSAPQFPNGVNTLDANGANPLSVHCQYTAIMNGTSAATPNVSGAVAMMLEANPKLSVRDIKYILAKTAKHVDSAFAGASSGSIIPGSTLVLEQGWITNAAGYSFSNRYGFGAVDAAAAVAAASSYSSYLPPVQNSTGNYQFIASGPATVPPQSLAGGTIKYTVSEAFRTVEFVVVFVNVASTPGLPCNQIELTSPAGTKSILLHAANGFTNSALANSRFESNAFYGEPVNGDWTLRFLDVCQANATSTKLSMTQPQVLLLSGH